MSGYARETSLFSSWLKLALVGLMGLMVMLFLLNGLDAERVAGTPTQAEITIKLRELANAIKAENVEEIKRLLAWFEKWNVEVHLDEMAGRFICMLCKTDLGPSATREDSAAICEQCGPKFFGEE